MKIFQELISTDVSGGYNSDDESDGEDWVPDPIDAKTGYRIHNS